jgi:hypothetical protein
MPNFNINTVDSTAFIGATPDTLTPADSGPNVNLGPAETRQHSDMLVSGNIGQVQISSGEATEQVDNITFEGGEPINLRVSCFTRGTLIATKLGLVEVQDITNETQIFTLDNGYQRIRWMGARKLSATQLAENPKLNPIRIKAGVFGLGTPSTDLIVSQQHRILIRSTISERIFDSPETLVAAVDLIWMEGIDVLMNITDVVYFHVLFDNHEIVLSNGSLTESLFVGSEILKSLQPEARDKLLALFPEMGRPNFAPIRARPIAKEGDRSGNLCTRNKILEVLFTTTVRKNIIPTENN